MRIPSLLLPLLLGSPATPPPATSPPSSLPTPAAASATGTLRGRVVDRDGRPIAEAHIEAFSADAKGAPFARAEAVSGPDGAFGFPDRPAGITVLAVKHPRFVSSERVSVTIDPAKGPTDVPVTLRRGGRITGSARRRDGSPLTDAVLTLSESGGRPAKRLSTRVGADGTFAISRVKPGPGLLVATVGDGGPGQHLMGRAFDVEDEDTVAVDLVVEEVIVSGRVTRSGAPGGGLRVTLSSPLSEPRHRIHTALFGPGYPLEPREALTDEDGAYSVIAEPGHAFVTVTTADGQTTFAAVDVEVPDEDSYLLDLAVGGKTSVSGIVTDRDTGEPLKDARVAVGPSAGAGQGGQVASTRADAEGRFELEAGPGEYLLRADHSEDGYAPEEMALSVPDDGVSHLHIALTPAPRMTIQAVDVAGKPIAGAVVIVGDARGRQLPRSWPSTDAEGRASLLNLERQPYSLFVLSHAERAVGFRPAALPAEGDVVVTLRPTAQLTVRTLEGETPVPAMVSVQSIDGHPMVEGPQPWTNADGFTILQVPPGTVEVIANRGRQGASQGRGSAVVPPGGTGDLTITIEPSPPGATTQP